MGAATFRQFDLAEWQLDCAIELYLRGDYLPALTLAGAAEELFGGPHALPAEQEAQDQRGHKQDARAFGAIYETLFGEKHPRPHTPVEEIKNRLKHPGRDKLICDPEDEAYWMIDRANYNRSLSSGNDHPRMADVMAHHARSTESASD